MQCYLLLSGLKIQTTTGQNLQKETAQFTDNMHQQSFSLISNRHFESIKLHNNYQHTNFAIKTKFRKFIWVNSTVHNFTGSGVPVF